MFVSPRINIKYHSHTITRYNVTILKRQSSEPDICLLGDKMTLYLKGINSQLKVIKLMMFLSKPV